MAEQVTEPHLPAALGVRRPMVTARRVMARAIVPAAWLVLLASILATRPLLPIDETRYASVAWEMWRTGDYLVPHLNGQPYSDKPPLLFWLITGGWSVLGPTEYWARLVGPLSAVVSVALTSLLARRLWPERRSLRLAAPIVLAGTIVWAVYSTLLLFDALLTACVLVGLLGLVEARGGRLRGFLMFAIGVGGGVLAKGPVILIHLLPAAVLAPWWDPGRQPAAMAGSPREVGGWRWAAGIVAATLGGAAIALAWAIPAAVAGGPTYARAIFVGQTAGRVVRSFAHRRPLWWYVPQLLWMTLPWIAWPKLWRGASAMFGARRGGAIEHGDSGLRFCASVAIPALVVFSIVSGKQVHYLLPEMPVFALAASRVLMTRDAPSAANADTSAAARIPVIAAATIMVVAVAHLAAAPYLAERYSLRDVATHLAALERSGAPIAHAGPYAGQFTFLGRLRHPIDEVVPDSIATWLADHPNGRVITYARTPNAPGPGAPELVRRTGGRYVIVRRAGP